MLGEDQEGLSPSFSFSYSEVLVFEVKQIFIWLKANS